MPRLGNNYSKLARSFQHQLTTDSNGAFLNKQFWEDIETYEKLKFLNNLELNLRIFLLAGVKHGIKNKTIAFENRKIVDCLFCKAKSLRSGQRTFLVDGVKTKVDCEYAIFDPKHLPCLQCMNWHRKKYTVIKKSSKIDAVIRETFRVTVSSLTFCHIPMLNKLTCNMTWNTEKLCKIGKFTDHNLFFQVFE